MCAFVCVCVCVLRPQSGQMYEHARPAGVNKELITLQAEEKPTEEPCYLTYHRFFLVSHVHGNL